MLNRSTLNGRLHGKPITLGFAAAMSWMLVLTGSLISHTANADDWPQWMGPSGDGIYRESGTVERLPEKGLEVLWRTPIAAGYAGPAVVGDRVYVFDYLRTKGEVVNNPGERATLSGKERMHCIDRISGKVNWTYEYECPYSISYPAGPRCTPTVDMDSPESGRVYGMGSEGDLTCLDAITGKLIWKRSFKNDYSAAVPLWGFSSHPLIEDGMLICMVGGKDQTVVAFDKMTGQERWKALSASAVGYCPPSIQTFGGARQLIVWHADAIVSLNPQSGKPYWQVDIKPEFEMSITKPQREGNLLYASAIRTNSVLLELSETKPAVTELWRGEPKQSVYCANSTPIVHEGVIYGTDCNEGCLIAVDTKSGERLWTNFQPTKPDETRRVSHGTAFLTRIDGTEDYLLMSEVGDLIRAKLTRDGYKELWRFHAVEPTAEAFGRAVVWSHPAYAHGTAFIRNDKELVAVRIAE